MKKLIMMCSILFACVFLMVQPSSATLSCDPWIGTWNVKLKDNSSMMWILDNPIDLSSPNNPYAGSTLYKCVVWGTQKQTGKADVPIQILVFEYVKDAYIYVPYQGRLTSQSVVQIKLNEKGDSFTVIKDDLDTGIVSGQKIVCTDADGDGYYKEGGACGTARDCDDTNKAINPGAQEVCDDGKDNNCDTQIDEGCGGECVDNDGDGYGVNCQAGIDCNDNDPTINAGAREVCGDGKDNDCDQSIDCDDTDCANEPTCQPCVITVSPSSVKARKILPRLVVLSITGSGPGFDASAEVTFDTAIRKLFQTAQGNDKILVIGVLKPGASGSTVTVSVEGCGSTDLAIE